VADSTLAELRQLVGVRSVRRVGERIEVRGDRRIIAYIGADLVRRGVVPDDLTVEVPNLESALLGLLDNHEGSPESSRPAGSLGGEAA
jgi:ABC-2 type transport system ATP-binding protein